MDGARGVQDLYLERTRAELDDLERQGLLATGSAFPRALLVKGEPGPAELAGGRLLSGPDGPALAAALGRLGFGPDDRAAVACFAAARDGACAPVPHGLLALAVEVFDPELVVALDDPAASALAAAWGREGPFVPGEAAVVRGRRVSALGGFEAALASPDAKQVAWARLKATPALTAPL